MEILMKLKCSASTTSHRNNNAHSTTLKVVDHHNQLTQQHAVLPQQSLQPPAASPSLTRLPTQLNMNYNSSSAMPLALHSTPRMPTGRPCTMNYTKPLECCDASVNQQEVELFDLQWREMQGRRGVTYEVSMQRPPSCCANITGSNVQFETPACCSGSCHLPGCGVPPIATEKESITSTGTALPRSTQPPPVLHKETHLQPPPLIYPLTCSDDAFADINGHYEYQEPEENFISIEDTKIKNLLMQIGRECELQRNKKDSAATKSTKKRNRETIVSDQHVVYEIIELDDEDDREELRQIRNQAEENVHQKGFKQNISTHLGLTISEAPIGRPDKPKQSRMKSPSISLIPKIPSPKAVVKAVPPKQKRIESKPSKERIIAHIELSDSSDSELEQCQKSSMDVSDDRNEVQAIACGFESDDADNDNDTDELGFAAAAVSCELECEDDDNVLLINPNEMSHSNVNSLDDDVVILNSDDENVEYVNKREKGYECNWTDSERREKGRQYFECYLCGKKVQSSYNLRRHMMIHTGERPFACDMCEKRFREFSDLKKHRRRHANDANFVCMVCRVKPPMIRDSTRCNDCDGKTSALTAMRPQQFSNTSPTTSSPDKPQTPRTRSVTPPRHLSQPPQLTAKPLQSTNMHIRDITTTTTTKTTSGVCSNTATNSTNNIRIEMMLPSTTSIKHQQQQQSEGKANILPNQKLNSNTTLRNIEMPSLVPINAPMTTTVNKTIITNTQLLLDNIPAVHRSNSNNAVKRKEFACPLCQRAFGTRHNLKRHYMIHTGEKPFTCDKCRKPFREYSTLKKHLTTHERDRYYKCLTCPRKYRDYLEYSEHKKMHANEDLNNDNDDDDDDDDDDYDDAAHIDQQHLSSSNSVSSQRKPTKSHYVSSEEDSSGEDWLECCECKQRFTDIELYTKHLKEHDPNVYLFECYICKKTFEHRDELVEHVGACKVELSETALQQRAKCLN